MPEGARREIKRETVEKGMKQTKRISVSPRQTAVGRPLGTIGKYRLAVQIAFVLICIWIGVEFHYFVTYLETGGAAGSSYRPPGVESFLPISSLMSLYYFLLTGTIHMAHPAGLFILLAVIVVSWLVGKSFCSWICPFGFLSELLGDLSEKLFGRRLALPRFLDYPLRSLKYLLLGFFVYSIFFIMDAASLKAFLDSPYNLMADVKMYYFFAEITRFSLIVIAALFVLSFFIRNFWCRYLCPYGALLGIFSLLSLTRIKRDAQGCIDCGLCAKTCPSRIKVDKVKTVVSDECTSCLQCVEVCPVPNTLTVKVVGTSRTVPPKALGWGIAGIFVAVMGIGMVTGHWHNNISIKEYLYHEPYLKSYGHPTGKRELLELKKKDNKKPSTQYLQRTSSHE